MSASLDEEESLESLQLIASAIAGRFMAVASAESGGRSWTDGKTVFLERDANPADRIRLLAVQVSLVSSGSLQTDILSHLVRRPALARRYLAVEGHRSLLVNEHVLPPFVRPLIDWDLANSVSTPTESLDLARGRTEVDAPPHVFGVIAARQVLAVTRKMNDAPLGHPHRTPSVSTDDRLTEMGLDSEDEDNLGDLLVSPVGGGGAMGRLLQKMFRPARRRGGGGPPGADAPTHRSSARADEQRDAVARMSSRGELEMVTDIGPEPAGTSYPEWDVVHGRYRQDWCTVREADSPAQSVSTAPLPDAATLRRSLARLGMGLTRCRRQPQGDDIDLDAAVEAHVDAVSGAPHGDDSYLESRRLRRDLSVLVLLDVSGSASEPGHSGKSVHEHQRMAALTLMSALHDLGDRVALYGFNSRGRRAVQLLRVKSFDDPLDVQVAMRLGSLKPAAFTRLGAAIRHSTSVVVERSGTPRRLLVVLSDGFAYDQGYQGRYGEADARRSLTEARRRGVGCVCLSVGTETDPQALRRVFGSAAHAALSRSDELPTVIAPLLWAALRSAERQQRTFQRSLRAREPLEVEREMG